MFLYAINYKDILESLSMSDLMAEVIERFWVLVASPLENEALLWAAAPLFIATLFMTLYFGKYSKEELGWNTAFGNTMVFLFVSMNLIHYMYFSDGVGSWDNVFGRTFYTTITFGLAGAAFLLMLITYYHLLPKKVAFFLFSAPPVNVSVYVLMTIVHAGVPADSITVGAGILLFIIIFAVVTIIQILERAAGRPEGLSFGGESKETPREKFLRKLREKNLGLRKERKKESEQEPE